MTRATQSVAYPLAITEGRTVVLLYPFATSLERG